MRASASSVWHLDAIGLDAGDGLLACQYDGRELLRRLLQQLRGVGWRACRQYRTVCRQGMQDSRSHVRASQVLSILIHGNGGIVPVNWWTGRKTRLKAAE